jgi:hypothetical protein
MASNKPSWAPAFVKALEHEIAEIRQLHLTPLETGTLRIVASDVDVTDREIESLRRNIKSIEAVIAQYRDMDD